METFVDVLIEREIQHLITSEKGDPLRTKMILESLQKETKLYKSDEKYIYAPIMNSELYSLTEKNCYRVSSYVGGGASFNNQFLVIPTSTKARPQAVQLFSI